MKATTVPAAASAAPAGSDEQRSGPAATARLPRLTSLRAFPALLVFGFHLHRAGELPGPWGSVFQAGYTGVAFFFALSGFVLAWSFRTGQPVAAFYLRRCARISPSHLVTLVAALLLPVTVLPVTGGAALTSAAASRPRWP